MNISQASTIAEHILNRVVNINGNQYFADYLEIQLPILARNFEKSANRPLDPNLDSYDAYKEVEAKKLLKERAAAYHVGPDIVEVLEGMKDTNPNMPAVERRNFTTNITSGYSLLCLLLKDQLEHHQKELSLAGEPQEPDYEKITPFDNGKKDVGYGEHLLAGRGQDLVADLRSLLVMYQDMMKALRIPVPNLRQGGI